MAYYSLEEPTGTINGSNKVFNVAHMIASVDHVFVDGLIYLGSVSFVSATGEITLGDAPTTSIYVDYFSTVPTPDPDPTPTDVAGLLTVQDVKDAYERYKRDISDVDDDVFIEWVQFAVRFIFDKVRRIDASRFIKSQSYSVVIPPQTEVLPDDFDNMNQTVSGLYRYSPRRESMVTFDESGDTDITFSDSGGTSAYNSEIKVQGESSRGFTGDAAATLLLSWETAKDWTDFDDGGAASPNNDYISIWVYVGNTIPTSATIEFSTLNTGASVGVNQFSYAYTDLVAGWNRIKVLKSAFTTTGSPSWSSLGYLRLIYTGGDTSTNIYWDKMDLVGNEVNDFNNNNRGRNTMLTGSKLGITGYLSNKEGFYLQGPNIIFTNSGLQEQDYVMKYLPVPPTLDELADYITVDGTADTMAIVEPKNLEYLVKAVDVLYEQWDANPSGESLADFRFVRELGGILDGFGRTPQISVIKNPSANF